MIRIVCIGLMSAAAACGGPSEQNAAITNGVPANGAVDVEVLPPDESVATPTNQLENGAAQPQVDDLSGNHS